MTLPDLYPPIVLATIVAGLWFIVAYRLNKRDVPGDESWTLILWLLSGPALVLAFFYSGFGLEPGDPLYTFFTALPAIGLGACVLASFSQSLNRATHRTARVYFMGCSAVIVVMFTAFLVL